MEQKRRTFITSPPLTAAVRINNKEVYDIDTVRAAARMSARYGHMHKAIARPATASSISHPPSLGSLMAEFASTAPSQLRGTSSSGSDLNGRQEADSTSLAFLSDAPLSNRQRTTRPKTAPSFPSPSLPASNSEGSQINVMPRDNALALSQVAAANAIQHDSQPATDDDVLFAFFQTVDQDSRDRTQSHTGSNNDTFASLVEEGRPRTARGNTASSGSSSGAEGGEESDLSTVHGHEPSGRGRRAALSVANSQSISRPKSATSAKGGMRSTDVRASSSTGQEGD